MQYRIDQQRSGSERWVGPHQFFFTNKTQFTTNIGYHAYTTDDKGTKHYKYVKVMERDSKTGKLKIKLDESGNPTYKRNSNNEQ